MKVAIIAVGTRGDVEPHAALCEGLIDAGYEARLCAPIDFAPSFAERNIPWDPIPLSFRQLCGSEAGNALLATGGNGLSFLRRLRHIAADSAAKAITGIRAACQDADAVCYSPLGLPARYFAEEQGIPAFATALQPLGRTASFPNPLLPLPAWTPGAINRLSYRLVEQIFWQAARPLLKPHMRDRLPAGGNFNELYERPVPSLFAYSSHVVPRPPDWKPWMHVTGYWNRPRRNWQPPADLAAFLGGGPAVCVGFGSMNSRRVSRIMDLTLEALALRGRRVIVLSGWSGYSGHRDSNVFVTGAVPHEWLFPRVSAVIHHGGAGTTAAALRAGIPSVILPFFFDQNFWGHRLSASGLGPAPIAFSRLSATSIAQAVDAAITSKEMRHRLRELSLKLREEDGVGNAVGVIAGALDRRGERASRLVGLKPCGTCFSLS